MPSDHSRPLRRHAAMRLFRKRVKRAVLFVVVIIAATFALNLFFKIGDYLPDSVKSPQEQEREMMMKRLEIAKKKTGEVPPQAPSRR